MWYQLENRFVSCVRASGRDEIAWAREVLLLGGPAAVPQAVPLALLCFWFGSL